jgi:hypothetical protein
MAQKYRSFRDESRETDRLTMIVKINFRFSLLTFVQYSGAIIGKMSLPSA